MPSYCSTQLREAPKPADGGIRHGMSRVSTRGQCAQHFVVSSRVQVVSARLRGHQAAAPIERAAGVAATRHPVHAHARPGQAERGHHVSEQRFALEHRSQRGLKLPQNEGPGLWSIPKFSVCSTSEFYATLRESARRSFQRYPRRPPAPSSYHNQHFPAWTG